MDRSFAVRELPALHAVAIRLRDEGYGDEVIATALGIDDDEVSLLLLIAERKLANQLALAGTEDRTRRTEAISETGVSK